MSVVYEVRLFFSLLRLRDKRNPLNWFLMYRTMLYQLQRP